MRSAAPRLGQPQPLTDQTDFSARGHAPQAVCLVGVGRFKCLAKVGVVLKRNSQDGHANLFRNLHSVLLALTRAMSFSVLEVHEAKRLHVVRLCELRQAALKVFTSENGSVDFNADPAPFSSKGF